MNDERLHQLLEAKIEWMEELYDVACNLESYKWGLAPNIRHRCGGEVYVYVEMTGIGYVCAKCEEAEIL